MAPTGGKLVAFNEPVPRPTCVTPHQSFLRSGSEEPLLKNASSPPGEAKGC